MASTRLSRTSGTPTSTRKFTISFWVKKSGQGADQFLVSSFTDANNRMQVNFNTDDRVDFIAKVSGSNLIRKQPTRQLRDPSAFYHILVAVDTTLATAADRCKVYINGSQESVFTYETNPSQNADCNVSGTHSIGAYHNGGSPTLYFDGILTHVHYTDGYTYAASTFGETDSTSGIWKPKTSPSVTYGTNGFFLKFANSASLGLDSSGNTNNFTVSGTGTQTQDTPSNNFATFNPIKDGRLDSGTQYTATFTNGNTTSTFSNSTYNTAAFSSLAVMGGKWYTEIKCSNKGGNTKLGLFSADDFGIDDFAQTYLYDSSGTINNSAYGNSFTTGDIIQIAFDSTNGNLWFGKNGTWQNSATQTEIENGTTANAAATGISTTNFWHFGTYGVNATAFQANFGNGRFGTTALASSNSDGDGLGLFEYSVPSGYYALCTKNIKNYG